MPSERRLHPLSPLFAVVASLRALFVPLLLLLFAARAGAELWIALFVIPSLLVALVRYASYRYVLTGDDLVIRTGLLFHNERHVPYSRIHNIAVVQNPLHRLSRVAEVRVETGGGSEPEARMQVLSLGAVEEMRRRVFAERQAAGGEAPAPEGRSVLRLPLREILLHGIIDNRGMVVVGAAAGLAWEMGLLDQDRLPGAAQLRRLLRSLGIAGGAAGWALLALGVVLGFVVLLRIFSIAWALVALHGFEVRSNGKELRTKYGLLTRSTTAIPMHRIQLLSVRERPLHRLFGRVEVQADTAGGNPAEEARRRRPRLAPLLRRDRLRRFVGDVQPGLDPDAVVWRPVHPRAGRRILKKSILLALAATAAAILPAGPWGALVLPPLLALAVVNARLQPPRMGWAATGEAVFWRCGWLWRRLILARTAKIQALSVSRSPFDRRWGMATLHVDTAGGRPGGERLRIRYLDAEAAAHLLDDLTARAAATAFRW